MFKATSEGSIAIRFFKYDVHQVFEGSLHVPPPSFNNANSELKQNPDFECSHVFFKHRPVSQKVSLSTVTLHSFLRLGYSVDWTNVMTFYDVFITFLPTSPLTSAEKFHLFRYIDFFPQ